MGVPKPIDIGPWDVSTVVHQESGSLVGATRLLADKPKPQSCYEIHSMRGTMTEDGTGDLASMAIATGDIPAGLTNEDGIIFELREELQIGGADVGSVLWTWGRSNQLGAGQGDGTIYLPPEFYWDGPMFGVFQNGAGATVQFLFTVVYRIVTFSRAAWPAISSSFLPGRARKSLTFTT